VHYRLSALALVLAAVVSRDGLAAASPPRPLAVEALKGSDVTIEIWPEEFAAGAGRIPCWTFVTSGLAAFKHPDLALTVKREAGEAERAFPRDALETIKLVADQVRQGTRLPAWTLTGIPDGQFGRKDLTGLIVLPGTATGPAFDRPHLTLLVVTKDELEVARSFGAARLTSMLGHHYRFYPTAPWLDRKRASIVKPADLEQSILSKVGRAWIPEASIWQVVEGKRRAEKPEPSGLPNAALEGNRGKVVLRLTPAAAGKLEQALSAIGDRGVLAILMPPAPNSDARLVWQQGSKVASAITDPAADPVRMAGNFVTLVAAGDDPGAQPVEDGFAVFLPGEAWKKAREAIAKKDTFSLAPTGGLAPFEIDWVADLDEPAAPEGASGSIPPGVRYKAASVQLNDAARAKLERFFAPAAASAEPLFGEMVVCGPFLWDQVKDAPELKGAGISSKLVLPSATEMQTFEGRLMKTKPDVAACARALASRFRFKRSELKVRRLDRDEISLFWAMIPFDMEEPLFIVEAAGHKLVASFGQDGRTVTWIDDLAGLTLKDGRLVKQAKAAPGP
jgi:hypothetical protein